MPKSPRMLKDHLSLLSYGQAIKLLKPGDGRRLLQQGGGFEIDVSQVTMDAGAFRLWLPPDIEVRLYLDKAGALATTCSRCSRACVHVGAALAFVLEEKQLLGLAAMPKAVPDANNMSDAELTAFELDERAQRAIVEPMRLRSSDPATPWCDYAITNHASGKSYRVVLRGTGRGDSYCSCPDFRKNTLGTCKHILHALLKIQKRFPARVRNKPWQPRELTVHLLYGEHMTLRLQLPTDLPQKCIDLVAPLRDKPIDDVHDLMARVRQIEALGEPVTIFPDAEEYIQQWLLADHLAETVEAIRLNAAAHPLRRRLLKADLLPYQLDGIAFAVGAGRAILADDMGLGKTIQGIGVAELLGIEANIQRVLVVTPASVKAQWRNEIGRFSHRDCQLVLGGAQDRARQFQRRDVFFTICNYEQVMRDAPVLENERWDLIILDEGQRIKNWTAKTSQAIKGLTSTFALVLTGTPLENRLDDLHSIVEFIDDRRLGPRFRFHHRHRVTDEKGKVLGYRNLRELRERLAPVLLRRTRQDVMAELPPRTNEIVRIIPTEEQLQLHGGFSRTVSQIINKPYLTEMDLLRLQKALLMCRLCANSTYLVNKETPSFSSKLERLTELIDSLLHEQNRKIVLFSEWTGMLDLIEPILMSSDVDYVRLDGSVPQRKRQDLVNRFQRDANCRLFMTTNAGATGLNLQAANTVINVDLPWNPALLEQRIGRVHRMGQGSSVQVFILVTEQTLEESLLGTLSAKHDLFLAALDPTADVDTVEMSSGVEELKRRLEVLLGTPPDAPVDESSRQHAERDLQQRDRIARTGGKMLSAAFDFLDEIIPEQDTGASSSEVTRQLREHLDGCIETSESGDLNLRVTLPDRAALDRLAGVLGRILTGQG